MEDLEPFFHERPDETQVFTPARERLRPQNEYLDSTAMIVMIQGAPTPVLPREIATVFARRFGWRSQDYQVSPAFEAPFLVICPGPNLKDAIVRGGVYTVRPGVQFRAIEWGIDLNMAYDPPPFEAWIRLTGLPYQAWNMVDIRKATTELGHITGILPYGRAAGHFRHVTIRIACEEPREISKHIKYHEGDLATIIRVTLISWRHYEHEPLPFNPPWEGQVNPNHHQPPPQDDPQQPPQSGTTSPSDAMPSPSSGGSNSVQGPRRRGFKILVNKTWGPLGKRAKTTPKVTHLSTPLATFNLKIGAGVIQNLEKGQVSQDLAKRLIQLVKDLSQATKDKGQSMFSAQLTMSGLRKEQKGQFLLEEVQSQEERAFNEGTAREGMVQLLQSERAVEPDFFPSPPRTTPHLMGLTEAQKMTNEEEEMLSHPPGFPKPIYKKKNDKLKKGKGIKIARPPQIRRSARLEEKKKRASIFSTDSQMGEKAAKAKKLKIEFAGRKEDIKEDLAISIIEETGVSISHLVRQAFKEAKARDEGIRAGQDQEERQAVQGIVIEEGHEAEQDARGGLTQP